MRPLVALVVLAMLAPGFARAARSTTQAGCMNQWMFNGIWRMRVTDVEWHPADGTPAINGWDVTMEWVNGTNGSTLTPVDTAIKDQVLALASGDTITATDSTPGTYNEQQLNYHSFPAGGAFTYTQHFLTGQTLNQKNKPAQLFVTFDPAAHGKYWPQPATGYNYRINLTCKK